MAYCRKIERDIGLLPLLDVRGCMKIVVATNTVVERLNLKFREWCALIRLSVILFGKYFDVTLIYQHDGIILSI